MGSYLSQSLISPTTTSPQVPSRDSVGYLKLLEKCRELKTEEDLKDFEYIDSSNL